LKWDLIMLPGLKQTSHLSLLSNWDYRCLPCPAKIVFFFYRVSLCSPGWPGTRAPSASTSECWDYRCALPQPTPS
jgi:hypothetical protein